MIRKFRIIMTVFSVFIGSIAFAQLTEPGGGDGSAPGDSGIAGGGAPIGSGITILIALGAAYSGKKIYSMNDKNAH